MNHSVEEVRKGKKKKKGQCYIKITNSQKIVVKQATAFHLVEADSHLSKC